MILRLCILIALILSTMPLTATAAPACHDAAMDAPMAHGVAMEQAPADPAPEPPVMGKALCVGCIAPATMRVVRIAPGSPLASAHGVPAHRNGLAAALATPEPPPPRG